MADRYAVGDPDDVSPRDRADRIRLGPGHDTAVTAQDMGVDPAREDDTLPPRTQPGEWLEHAPLLTVPIGVLPLGWLMQGFAREPWRIAIANLNRYNSLFFMAGAGALAAKAVPERAGVHLARCAAGDALGGRSGEVDRSGVTR
jgi:short subunit fatty acids transporter